MKLQKQPNHWSCLPTAFAMVLDVDVQDIFKYLGHDGSQIVFPNMIDPRHQRRCFHVGEMVNYCFHKQFACIHTYATFQSTPDGNDYFEFENSMFIDLYNYQNGVASGITDTGNYHALARYGGELYDPSTGDMYHGHFVLQDLFIIYPLKVM